MVAAAHALPRRPTMDLPVTALDTAAPYAIPQSNPLRLIAVVGLAVLLSELVFLGGAFFQGFFIVDRAGHGIANDFVNVWAAGRLVLDGQPAAAYDWTIHRQVQEAAVGHVFEGAYRWHYPPPFLFAAALAATLPYVPAGLAWLLATAAAYAAAIRGILGHRAGWLFALGFPGAIWNVTAGQNGFLTTALIGGALGLLERHPVLAGCCLGLLTYKPHFGVLFPLVLAATGRWRTFWTAAAVALVMAALSWLAFGSAPWAALMQSVSTANQLVLTDGGVGWNKLQSVFGLVRALGGGETLAWIVHGTLALAGTASLVWLWRSRAPFDLKAAALAVGVVLLTPYVFAYDLVALAVPAAFLLRFGLAHGVTRSEAYGLAAAGALLLSYIVATTQVGLAASLIVAWLIGRRVWDCAHASTKASSATLA
jgi:arabinofuranan 3-O-arabinosyltransferase